MRTQNTERYSLKQQFIKSDKMIYLDNSATIRPFDSVIKAVSDNMAENFGNASSLHGMGVNAEKVIKEA